MEFYHRYTITFYDGTIKLVGAKNESDAIIQVLSESNYTEDDIADICCE